MSRAHLIEALVALFIWAMIPCLFFGRDLRQWWRTRYERRARNARLAREKAEAQRRTLDELAAKYPLPSSSQTP